MILQGMYNASLNKSKIYEKIKGIEEELNLAELKLNESNADYERLLEELSSLDMEKAHIMEDRRRRVPDILHRIHTAVTVRQRKSRSV